MKDITNYNCPFELIHNMIKGKWKPIILWNLNKKVSSLSNLNKSIGEVSNKILIQNLNELISYKVVSKKSYEGYPLKVEYSLTSRGKRLFDAICIMQSIGIEIMIEDGKEEVLKEKGLL